MKKSEGTYLQGHGPDGWIGWSTHIERCPWCRKGKPAHVEFYDLADFVRGVGWQLVYPGCGAMTVCLVSHATQGCGPGAGYWLRLDDLARDPNGWYRQLNDKDWGRGLPVRDVIYDLLLLHRKDAYSTFHPPDRRALPPSQEMRLSQTTPGVVEFRGKAQT